MDGPAMQSDADKSAVRWIRMADAARLQHAACERVLAAAALAIEHRGEFLIVLARRRHASCNVPGPAQWRDRLVALACLLR